MNRRGRRRMVKNTKDGTINPVFLAMNSKPISEILLGRMEKLLTAKKIDYMVVNGEIKSSDSRVDDLYEEQLTLLKEELIKFKGDYKKIKV